MQSGNYVGYIASSFTFGRFVGSYALGHLTDSIGRKPVIVVGLLSMTVFSLAFALSPTFGFALLSRCVQFSSRWSWNPVGRRMYKENSRAT